SFCHCPAGPRRCTELLAHVNHWARPSSPVAPKKLLMITFGFPSRRRPSLPPDQSGGRCMLLGARAATDLPFHFREPLINVLLPLDRLSGKALMEGLYEGSGFIDQRAYGVGRWIRIEVHETSVPP